VTENQVTEIVNRLAAAFPDPVMAEGARHLYHRLLIDLEYDETDEAVDDLLMTMMKLPTISRIRRTVIEPLLDLPTADEAWAALQSRQQQLNPLVARTAALMGGSSNLRTSSDPELSRMRFVKVYDDLRRVVVDEAIVARARTKRMRLPKAS
jgi:hypothetical protein